MKLVRCAWLLFSDIIFISSPVAIIIARKQWHINRGFRMLQQTGALAAEGLIAAT